MSFKIHESQLVQVIELQKANEVFVMFSCKQKMKQATKNPKGERKFTNDLDSIMTKWPSIDDGHGQNGNMWQHYDKSWQSDDIQHFF